MDIIETAKLTHIATVRRVLSDLGARTRAGLGKLLEYTFEKAWTAWMKLFTRIVSLTSLTAYISYSPYSVALVLMS